MKIESLRDLTSHPRFGYKIEKVLEVRDMVLDNQDSYLLYSRVFPNERGSENNLKLLSDYYLSKSNAIKSFQGFLSQNGSNKRLNRKAEKAKEMSDLLKESF